MGAKLVLWGTQGLFPRMRKVWVDYAYRGLKAWVKAALGWTLEVVHHGWTGVRGVWVGKGAQPPELPGGFQVLPRRWVVERSLAWYGRNRRLSKDYERNSKTEETFIYAASAFQILRRLARLRKKGF